MKITMRHFGHKKRKQLSEKDFEKSDRATMQPWLNNINPLSQESHFQVCIPSPNPSTNYSELQCYKLRQ